MTLKLQDFFIWFFLIVRILKYNKMQSKCWRTLIDHRMYHQQQNKCYPQRCFLANFEATLDFSRIEFTCPCMITYDYHGQINGTFGGTIYFAVDGTSRKIVGCTSRIARRAKRLCVIYVKKCSICRKCFRMLMKHRKI